MCSENHHFSSSPRRMSSSDDKPQFSQKNPVPETSKSEEKSNPDRADDDQSSEESKKGEEEEEATVSNRESEKQIILEENDDGFKTPTSSDHRIPAITQCPPAPKKPRPQPSGLKRKASPPPGAARRFPFDASTAEVESIFRPIDDQDDSSQDPKTKRARTDDKDKS